MLVVQRFINTFVTIRRVHLSPFDIQTIPPEHYIIYEVTRQNLKQTINNLTMNTEVPLVTLLCPIAIEHVDRTAIP